MTTARIKEKISAIVSSQLPEFVQSDFNTFVSFIEAYYRFLEQDQNASEIIQNARSYNDIDRTTEPFVEYFLNTYIKNFPRDWLVDNRFLIKKINDLYESKGSDLSFKLLFKILFNTSVEVNYPFENVLRPSSGIWQQNFSIFVETISGNRNILSNRVLTHSVGEVVFQTPINRTRLLTPTLTEIFLEPTLLSPSYSVGDIINVFENQTLVFSGVIKPTTTNYIISTPGTGFKQGQIFNISAGGTGTLVQATKVSSTGGLLSLKIVAFGYGYTGDNDGTSFTIVLDKNENIARRETFFNSKTGGFGSSGQLIIGQSGFSGRYFLDDYVDNFFYTISGPTTSFNNDVFTGTFETTGGTVDPNFSTISFTLGALARYPGSYVSDRGFLSEAEVRLQDDKLYQPFAYQTNTGIDISLFADIVKKLINPAGMVLFNNRILSQDISLSEQIDIDRKIYINVHDSSIIESKDEALKNTFGAGVGIIDADDFHTFYKNLTNTFDARATSRLQSIKPLINNVELSDNVLVTKIYLRDFLDSFSTESNTVVNTNKLITDDIQNQAEIKTIEFFEESYFSEDYTQSTQQFYYVLNKIDEVLNP
jgi:hypothetical protein